MESFYSSKGVQKKKLNTDNILYIGNLPNNVDQYDLSKFINSYDPKLIIKSISVRPVGSSKAYSYVKLQNKAQGSLFI